MLCIMRACVRAHRCMCRCMSVSVCVCRSVSVCDSVFALPLFAFHLHIFLCHIFYCIVSVYRCPYFFGLSLKIFNFHFTVFLREIAEKTFPDIRMQTESCCENWNTKVSKMYRTLCIWVGKEREIEWERKYMYGRQKETHKKGNIKVY